MKKVITSTIILFFCILFYKNADAAVISSMNSNTGINNVITATDGSTREEVQISSMVSVTSGESFTIAQVGNFGEVLETGGTINIENMDNLEDFPSEYMYNPGSVSIDNEAYKINVTGTGIAVLKITSVIDTEQYNTYFAVNGVSSTDGTIDIYNAIAELGIAIEQVSVSGGITGFETAYDIYKNYYEAYLLVKEYGTFEADIDIQYDGVLNIWKITNGSLYFDAATLLSGYFGTESERFLLSEVKFISEFEGVVLKFGRKVTENDLLAYAFYNEKAYDPDAGIVIKSTIKNQDGSISSSKKSVIYQGEDEIRARLVKKLRKKGTYNVEVSGTGLYTSSAKYTFRFIFQNINKGAYIKKSAVIYSGIYKGGKKGTAKAKSRYHCIAKSSSGWYKIKLNNGEAGYIKKGNVSLSEDAIANIVNIYDAKYSYADMSRDIKKMAKFYQDVMELSILTITADNNNVYCARLGNQNAKKKVIIQSTMHAREWLNSQLVMKMLERCCKSYYSGRYKGTKYSTLFNKTCFYIIPMLNPDGVNISQYGLARIKKPSLRNLVKRLAKGNYRRWKANAEGVDLNRNYGPGFRKDKGRGSEAHSGPYAYSERETKALVKLIDKVKPKAVINYHEAGRVIYYTKSSSLLRLIRQKTGYSPVRESIRGANGSLGDYLTRKGITWCTPETCATPAPVSHSQFYYEWGKHRDMIPAVAKLYQ